MDPNVTKTQGTQFSPLYSLHEVNTTAATFKESGMYHFEGGWPKDINIKDLEQTVRYKRKIEKDELYIHTMLQLLPLMEHNILQNNVCNIYEQYFNDLEPIPLVQKTYSRTINVYCDPSPVKRPITHLSWSSEQGDRLAASYCKTKFGLIDNRNTSSYIWDVENPNEPFMELKPEFPMWVVEYNPKDSNTLAGGLKNGQVAIWDIRKGIEPVETSLYETSHRDTCNNVLWINSKTNTEFFSASRDGQIKWWDTRKLQAPTDTLIIDLITPDEQNIENAIGVSALQFEPSMSTRFMCGLDNGIVISGNRKGKTPSEKMASKFQAGFGPIMALERNPTFVKNFLTISDWTARLWSEDCKESSISWTPADIELLTGGTWSATRFSVFFVTKFDGTLDVWDFLIQQNSPVLSVKICDEALTSIKSHEQGQLTAVGNDNGVISLIEFSQALTVNQKNDKLLFTALLERETRREKVIEAKNREIRLKMKSNRTNLEQDHSKNILDGDENPLYNAIIRQAEQDYENAVQMALESQVADDDDPDEFCSTQLDD